MKIKSAEEIFREHDAKLHLDDPWSDKSWNELCERDPCFRTCISAIHAYHKQFSIPKQRPIFEHIRSIKNALDEHFELLKEVNKSANMETLYGYWDYQTVAEANEALVEIERYFNPSQQKD